MRLIPQDVLKDILVSLSLARGTGTLMVQPMNRPVSSFLMSYPMYFIRRTKHEAKTWT